jgi:hypothetical protein
LAKLSTSAATLRNHEDTEYAEESFDKLVNGQPKDEVARSFSALLQLVSSLVSLLGPFTKHHFVYIASLISVRRA